MSSRRCCGAASSLLRSIARRSSDLARRGTNELIYMVGHYCFVSMSLNGFAVPAPDEGVAAR